MVFFRCCLGFTLIIFSLAIQVSETFHLPKYEGLLNSMPPGCIGRTFCHVQHDNATQNKIDELLTLKYKLTLVADGPVSVDRDYIDEEGLENPCKVTSPTYSLIYLIVDTENRVRKVVQSPKLFTQEIRIQECVFNDTDTSISESVEEKIPCKQNTSIISFLVLTPDGEGVEYVKNKGGIPVCCSSNLK